MHEIGHNINLDHGGNTPENCNPNYLSVMSYSRQFSDLVNRPLDYSHKKLSDIDEQSLPDNLGQSFIPNQDIVFQTPHGLGYWRAGSSPPIPWGVSPPSFNVNNLSSAPDTGCSDPDSPADVLAGFNDWDPLRLKITARTSTTNWRD